MKTEKELSNIAAAIATVLSQKRCNHADIMVILGMLQHDLFYQLNKAEDKEKESHKVKIE